MDRVGTAPSGAADEGASDLPPTARERPLRHIESVPLTSLRPGDSPRLGGEDRAHISRLAEIDAPLPPILVDRDSMRVIDGIHRLMAASLKGQEVVEVIFFDGSPADAFLCAVEANAKHGLPLSLADRRAAAARIAISHPHLSDRAISEKTGLGAKTVAGIRRSSADQVPEVRTRVGRDGRVRPLDRAEGRQRAAAWLTEHPEASLREVARRAGVSPATVRDVRRRLASAEDAVPGPAGTGPADSLGDGTGPAATPSAPAAVTEAVGKLLKDPSLRHNEYGRRLLRLLQINAAGLQEWPGAAAAVPPHCVGNVGEIAQYTAQMWLGIVQELEGRARLNDPRAGQFMAQQ